MKILKKLRNKIADLIMFSLLDDYGIGIVLSVYMENKHMTKFSANTKTYDGCVEYHITAEKVK